MKKIFCLLLLAFSSASFAFTFQLNRAPLKLKPLPASVNAASKPAPVKHLGHQRVYLSPAENQKHREISKRRIY
jgi:hypothetical protein